jgi:uroporphyrinogen decarboxylase
MIRNIPKIWLMRQAGRYMPEYQIIRKSVPSFLELCYDSEKAANITMQPVDKFNLDAAIVFSDILVTADSLKIKVEFKEGQGPVLEKVNNLQQAKDLVVTEKCWQFDKITRTIELVKKRINNKPIIGFIGGSWTVCAYILEGIGKTGFKNAIKKIYTDPLLLEVLIEKITQQNIYYIKQQIQAGATFVQIFESHAGIVPPEKFQDLIIKPTNKICSIIKKEFPNVSIIGFPKGCGYLYERFIEETDIDIIGCDQYIPIEKMQQWQNKKILQGNLDPLVLFSNPETIKKEVDNIMKKLDTKKLIFNLGHGILPDTPVENVKFLSSYVQSWKKQQ